MLAQPPALWLVLLAFVCMLGPLVFFHELGHYLVARWFKVPAEVFSIGFGHEIVRLDRPPGHALEGRLAAAWRLCEIRRRHEPGEQPAEDDIPPEHCATGHSSCGRSGNDS